MFQLHHSVLLHCTDSVYHVRLNNAGFRLNISVSFILYVPVKSAKQPVEKRRLILWTLPGQGKFAVSEHEVYV